jgi:hypothetical protein
MDWVGKFLGGIFRIVGSFFFFVRFVLLIVYLIVNWKYGEETRFVWWINGFYFFENWVFYGNNNLSKKKKVINSQLWKRDKFHLKWEDIYIYIYICFNFNLLSHLSIKNTK